MPEFLPDFLSFLSVSFLELSSEALAFRLRLGDALLSGDLDFAPDEVRAEGSASELVLAVDCLFEDFALPLPMPNNGNGINGFPKSKLLRSRGLRTRQTRKQNC